LKRILTGLAIVALMAGCAADMSPDSSAEQIAAAAYHAPGSSITLFTMVNNRSGAGGHTALLVNGSQQVIFDPAGSFRDARVTERGDVLYGMNTGWVQAYRSAHARNTHHVVSQEMRVTPAQAETLLGLVQSNGAVPGAYCANATSALLAQVDGFSDIKRTYYPVNLMEQLAKLPNVKTTKYFENDNGKVMTGAPVVQ
jgi:hypothetical protein